MQDYRLLRPCSPRNDAKSKHLLLCHCENAQHSWQSITFYLAIEYFLIAKIMDCFVLAVLAMTQWEMSLRADLSAWQSIILNTEIFTMESLKSNGEILDYRLPRFARNDLSSEIDKCLAMTRWRMSLRDSTLVESWQSIIQK